MADSTVAGGTAAGGTAAAGAQPRVLAIMGSGETSPTMVTVHKVLAGRLGAGQRGSGQHSVSQRQHSVSQRQHSVSQHSVSQHRAILLDTPYAFQENAADISARSQAYFARSVGLEVEVVSDIGRSPATEPPPAHLAAIRSSDWVFAGPGSPTYALARWRGPIADALRDRIAAGTGLTIIASAAAAAIGSLALPVYEIYKVGADPHWLEGLDLLTVLGLKVALIPHYDNAEGGTHDTRFCYLGERRLAMIERELAADAAVLGVDEHTALVLDLDSEDVTVLGRGGATVRKAGVSTVLPSGSTLTLTELRALIKSGTSSAGSGQSAAPASKPSAGAGEQAGSDGGDDAVTAELPELTTSAEGKFEVAVKGRDSAGMVSAILNLESAIEAWASDTDENDNADRARAVLRGLVVRLGKSADAGLVDPADRLRPLVEPLIKLRESFRKDGAYGAADDIRAALTAGGVELRDSAEGTGWALTVPSG